MRNLLSILLVSILLISCNERKEISITFAYEKPILETKTYPSYFKELTVPFTSDCNIDVLMKPINITRLDISNKEIQTTAWYFEDIGDNTIEFSKLWLESYFKDSLIDNYLTLPPSKEVNLENWISNIKDSLYIFDEESEVEYFKGKKVFNSSLELHNKIKEIACNKDVSKVTILVLEAQIPEPNFSNLNLVFNSIIDLDISPDQRIELIPNILETTFSKNSTIEEIGENGTSLGITPTVEYLNQIVLSRTINKIEIIEGKKDETGKFWTVKIIEHHNLIK